MTKHDVPHPLLDAVVEYFDPQRVILFGSRARGDAGPDSDIDLIVIVDDETPPERLTLKAGFEARRHRYREAADIIPCRASVYDRKRTVVGSLAYTAAQEGVVVYER